MADGDWHSIAMTLDGNITLVVDGKSYIEEQCYSEQDNEDLDLSIGKSDVEPTFVQRDVSRRADVGEPRRCWNGDARTDKCIVGSPLTVGSR